MKLSDFDYYLPKNLIAQEPVKPRDHSRLLVLGRKKLALSAGAALSADCTIEHKHFYDIVDYLQAGDVLVLNNSKVFPARLIGKKKGSEGKIEVFLLPSPPSPLPLPNVAGEGSYKKEVRGTRQCLLGGKGRKEGLKVEFYCRGNSRIAPNAQLILSCQIIKNNHNGTWQVKFNKSGNKLMKIVDKIGLTPLPPYIKRRFKRHSMSCKTSNVLIQDDKVNYQTVYADDKKIGSVAAPTAGFHFTPRLIKKLKNKGVQFEYITLHIGFGTFAPIKVNNITKHKMHAEWVEVKKGVIERMIKAKKEKRRIITVGTTSIRALESVFATARGLAPLKGAKPLFIQGFKGWADIFIYPPFKFKIVDAMITNFHLPKSTLLMLVIAFAGKTNIDKAYRCAINNKYRFYSYGDAMFIY